MAAAAGTVPIAADVYTPLATSIRDAIPGLPQDRARICAQYTLWKPEESARYSIFSDLADYEKTLLRTAAVLDCKGNEKLTWDHVQTLRTLVPQLRRLDLRNCPQLSHNSAEVTLANSVAKDALITAFIFHKCVVVQTADTSELVIGTEGNECMPGYRPRREVVIEPYRPEYRRGREVIDSATEGNKYVPARQPRIAEMPSATPRCQLNFLRQNQAGSESSFSSRPYTAWFDVHVHVLPANAAPYTAFSTLHGTFGSPSDRATVEEITDAIAKVAVS